MADELGAVRRTPRPTGDRQTPETVAQLPRGATNAPTPVSADTGNATDDLRAADGIAVHIASEHVRIGERYVRQRCGWCGFLLSETDTDHQAAYLVAPGRLVEYDRGQMTLVPYDGGELPPGCCALPDDETPTPGPGCYPPADGWDGVAIPATCGKHVPGTSSNRCLLRPGHTGDHSAEFETPQTPPCTCTENRCDYDDHDNPLTGDECVPCGQRPEGTPCCALDGPDEAQETRAAADWPAKEADRG